MTPHLKVLLPSAFERSKDATEETASRLDRCLPQSNEEKTVSRAMGTVHLSSFVSMPANHRSKSGPAAGIQAGPLLPMG